MSDDVSKEKKVVNYLLVRGRPEEVEREVKILINEDDWQPHGELYPYNPPASNQTIFIQAMILKM